MTATLTSPTSLETIDPKNIDYYLASRGWLVAASRPGRFTLWSRSGSEVQVMVPASAALIDYAIRVSEMLSTLESLEQRSQISIAADIRRAWADTLRFVRASEGPEDDSILLDAGAALINNARSAMLAAACSATQPRAFYPNRKPEPAEDYIRHLRIGHTEPGSYIVTIISPLAAGTLPLFEDFVEQPFARRAARMLLESLRTAMVAATESEVQDSVEPLLDRVGDGVSANLLDAIAGINVGAGASQVQVRASWATASGLKAPEIDQATIPSRLAPIFKEASRILKEGAPLDNIEIHGFITDLHRGLQLMRDTPEAGGIVTITGQIEGVLRRVNVELPLKEYEKAAEANTKGFPVQVDGDLIKEGRSYFLRNPRPMLIFANES